MIVTCEACGTSYKVKSSMIRPSGSTVRCSRCQHVFVAYPAVSEPQFEKPSEKQAETPPSEADFSHPGSATFLADAAETEKQLDAFFAEDFEAEPSGGSSEAENVDAPQRKQDADFPAARSGSLFETAPGAGPDLATHETADSREEDSFELDFPDFSEDSPDQIYMEDLEYDTEMSFSALEETANLDFSDLEQDADLELSSLEKQTETADFSLADLEAEAGPDLAEVSTPPQPAASPVEAEAEPELDFSDLDADTELDFSDPGAEADMDISDLEAESGGAFAEPGAEAADDSDAVLDLSGHTVDAQGGEDFLDSDEQEVDFDSVQEDFDFDLDEDFPDILSEPEPDLSGSEAQADLDLSDLEADEGKDFGSFQPETTAESDAELTFSDLTADVEMQPEFEQQEQPPVDEEPDEETLEISDLTLEVDEDAAALGSPPEDAPDDLEPEPEPEQGADAGLNFSDLIADTEIQPAFEQEQEQEQEQAAFADEEPMEISEFAQGGASHEETGTSFETAQEEFDLDLDTFELNLDEDASLEDRQGSGFEGPGEKKTKAETDEMTSKEYKSGETEEDLFDLELDFDFEESPEQTEAGADKDEDLDLDLDVADEEPEAPAAPAEPGPVEPDKKEKSESRGVYEVNLELGDAGQEDDDEDDFLADLDLDFDETPDDAAGEVSQQAPAEAAGEEKKQEPDPDSDLELDLTMDTGEGPDVDFAPEKQQDAPVQEDFDLDLEEEKTPAEAEDFSLELDEPGALDTAETQSRAGAAEGRQTGMPEKDQADSGDFADLDLDLSEDMDSASAATEEDDFELNLETMFAEDDEDEFVDEKSVSLEAVDSETEEVGEDDDFPETEAEGETVFFSGVTDGPEDAQSPDQDLAEDSVFDQESAGYAADGFQPGGARKKPVWKILALLVILAAVAAGAYVYYYGLPMENPGAPDPGNQKIAVSDPSYQFMDNQSAGEILVITGSITNRYDHARQNIRVEAGVYDQQGTRMDATAVICGNTLTQQQLRNLDPGEIRQALGRTATVANQSPVVQAGGNLPFMAVFANPPDGIAELTVDALSSEKS
ncbi:MAG: zinc-ribbon domain-containing protein [Desulfobacteraceae bacterium]|nr:zinc-ribbon domain-containing protein [Desulfobacteraceae bacterium]